MEQEGGKAGRFEDGSDELIAACIEVHRHVGPGLLESVYEQCLAHELALRGLRVERQRVLPVIYIERLLPVHEAQVITYLKLTGLATALLVNFNVAALRQGLRRLTNK